MRENMDDPEYLDGTIEIEIKEDYFYRSEARVKIRGNTRKAICTVPPLKVDLKKSTLHPTLDDSDKIDIVNTCKEESKFISYLYKEYLAYKIYNIITKYSYQVRLLKPSYEDTGGMFEIIEDPAFIVESDKAVEDRVGANEKGKYPPQGELALMYYVSPNDESKHIITRLALFQYMIGNTDWAPHSRHNCRIFKDGEYYYPIPYDFDYSGFVDAPYAIPGNSYNLSSVRERFYQGVQVEPEIFNEEAAYFIEKKPEIYELIQNFTQLSEKERNKSIKYLDDFYKELENGDLAKKVTI